MTLNDPLSRALADTLRGFSQSQHCWVALSGGADSMALAHALVLLKQAAASEPEWAWLQSISIRAVHVHHGLSDQADTWQRHVTRYCELWQLPLRCVRVNVEAQGFGLEAAARAQRYEAFGALLAPNDVLMTAHHQDDQAETLLLNLLRGAGLRGLAAMRPQRPLAKGILLRPFLSLSRQQLQDHCQQYKIGFVEDPSNTDVHHRRSFLRRDCIPQLQTQWPSASASLAKSAQHLAAYEAYFEQRELALLTECAADQKQQPLPLQVLIDLPLLLQRRLINTWLRMRGTPAVPGVRLDSFLAQLQDHIAAKKRSEPAPQTAPILAWEQWQLRYFSGQLHLLAPAFLMTEAGADALWDLADGDFSHPWFGTLRLNRPMHNLRLRITQRRGGERLKDSQGRHLSVKKLLQSSAVPPWQRDRIPLLFNGDELWAVGDIRLHPEFARLLRLANCRISWQAVSGEEK